MSQKLDHLRSQLATLETSLKTELDHVRMPPRLETKCGECDVLCESLRTEKIRNDDLQSRIEDAQTDLGNAGDLVESLRDEVRREASLNEQLRKKNEDLINEYATPHA